MTASTLGLPSATVQAFARGLFEVAHVDGIETREEQLIREFLRDAGSTLKFEDLAALPFDADELALALETSYFRRLFVRTAIALVKLDGVFSDGERHILGEIADAFGLSNAEFGDLEQEAARTSLT